MRIFLSPDKKRVDALEITIGSYMAHFNKLKQTNRKMTTERELIIIRRTRLEHRNETIYAMVRWYAMMSIMV